MKGHAIIVLNGPPRSGKDTAAHFIHKHFLTRRYKMATPVKRAIKAMFNVPDKLWFKIIEGEDKDQPQRVLAGKTPHEIQISFSEHWAKIFWDQSVFGVLAARELSRGTATDFTVISDGGFVEEVVPLIKMFPHHVLIIQLHRDGCDFSKDSRSYIEHPNADLIKIENKYDLELFQTQVVKAVADWSGEQPTGGY